MTFPNPSVKIILGLSFSLLERLSCVIVRDECGRNRSRDKVMVRDQL
jgi:hypothetical protein